MDWERTKGRKAGTPDGNGGVVGKIRKTKGGVGARKIEGENGRADDDVVGEISLKRGKSGTRSKVLVNQNSREG
jgi:hypothetical protein